MAFELEALVGHLYVAGGRTIKTTPPGALCEVAPKRCARGREIDTFFVLVLPSGVIAPNTFYEQMSLMAAERYFSNSGSVTSALRDVMNTLNNNLFEHNASGRKHYEANMLAVVLRGKELYVARAGAAVLILRHSGETKTLPPSLVQGDASIYKPPLGLQPIPDVEMTRFTIDSGTRMILSDSFVAEITENNLTQALVAANIERTLDDLKVLVTLQIQMMAVEFVIPDTPVNVPVTTGQSSAVISAEIAATRAKVTQQQKDTQTVEVIPEPPRNVAQERLKSRTRAGLATIARTAGHSLTATSSLTEKLIGGKDRPEVRRRNSMIITMAVIGIPAFVIAIVMLSWVLNIGQTAYEECATRAQEGATFAHSIANNQQSSVLAAWQGTLAIVAECRSLRPDAPDPIMDQIARDGQAVIDQLNNITRRSATIIDAIPGANIREVIRQGLDLYALDTDNNLVYRLQLSLDGLSLASQRQPIANMRGGARVEGNTVGQIIGITFDENRSQIVALDNAGLLISCRPNFLSQCESQRLLAVETWVNPIRFAMWQGNVYVMDVGTGQLWRYEPTGGTYASQPTEYFRSATRPDLTNAVDFVIGSSASGQIRGNVYVLYENGAVSAHFGGDPLPFTFANFRDGQDLATVTSQAMYLNDSPIDTGFYFISRPARTVYETTAAGTWIATYRVFDESLFERLNDVVADPQQGIIYVASGNSIFAIKKRE